MKERILAASQLYSIKLQPVASQMQVLGEKTESYSELIETFNYRWCLVHRKALANISFETLFWSDLGIFF